MVFRIPKDRYQHFCQCKQSHSEVRWWRRLSCTKALARSVVKNMVASNAASTGWWELLIHLLSHVCMCKGGLSNCFALSITLSHCPVKSEHFVTSSERRIHFSPSSAFRILSEARLYPRSIEIFRCCRCRLRQLEFGLKFMYLKNWVQDHYQTARHERSSCH